MGNKDIIFNVHVMPHFTQVYLDKILLIEMPKHPRSILYVEPYANPNLFPGLLTTRYKGNYESSCPFSRLTIGKDCIEYIDKPICIELAEYVGFVID